MHFAYASTLKMWRNKRDEQTNEIDINGNGRVHRRNEVRSQRKTATYLRSTTVQIALKMKMKIRKKNREHGTSNKPRNYEYKIINKHLRYSKWGAWKRNIVIVSLSKWFFMWCGFTVMLLFVFFCRSSKEKDISLCFPLTFYLWLVLKDEKMFCNMQHKCQSYIVQCTFCSGLDQMRTWPKLTMPILWL